MSDMQINQILAQMRALNAELQPRPPAESAPADRTSFADVMQQAVAKVNEQQATANAMATDFQTGATDVSVAEVMVQMQKASLSFQAMSEVRNKLVEAYREIMNMPI